MTCYQLSCVLDSEHKGDCNYSKVGPYKCPNKHWIYFETPTSQATPCMECGVVVFRGDLQP